jgi:hypothetical protein
MGRGDDPERAVDLWPGGEGIRIDVAHLDFHSAAAPPVKSGPGAGLVEKRRHGVQRGAKGGPKGGNVTRAPGHERAMCHDRRNLYSTDRPRALLRACDFMSFGRNHPSTFCRNSPITVMGLTKGLAVWQVYSR